MSEGQQAVSTPDDRLMAALAHGAMILGLWGILISGIIWGTQREKSAYLRFQALQAMVYQIVTTVSTFLLAMVWGLCVMGFFVLAMSASLFALMSVKDPSAIPDPLVFLLFNGVFPMGAFCLMSPVLLIEVAVIAYAFYGAYQAYRGRDFRYVVIGPRVERYLAQSRPKEA